MFLVNKWKEYHHLDVVLVLRLAWAGKGKKNDDANFVFLLLHHSTRSSRNVPYFEVSMSYENGYNNSTIAQCFEKKMLSVLL